MIAGEATNCHAKDKRYGPLRKVSMAAEEQRARSGTCSCFSEGSHCLLAGLEWDL